MNLFICLSSHFQVQEARAAEPRVMSEGDERHRHLLFIGDGRLGLNGLLIPFRSQKLWPAIICLRILLISSFMTVRKTCCALSVLPSFGILRGICNLVALLLRGLLLRNHPSCAFI